MSVNIHNQLLTHYHKLRLQKEKKEVRKESIVRQSYIRKPQQVDMLSPVDDFIRNQEHLAVDSDPLSFRNLPRALKVHFPGPPQQVQKLTEVPYTYEIVQPVPFKVPKQKPGEVGKWVLQESGWKDRPSRSVVETTTVMRKKPKSSDEIKLRFRTAVKKLYITMRDSNLSLDQVIKNKGLIKKPHNFYNSLDFFALVKKGDTECERMLEVNPYLAFDVDNQMMTPLHWSARQGHPYLTKVLLQKFRANVHARDSYGRTPLHLAVTKKNIQCMARIFIEGAKLNAMNLQKKTVRAVAPDAYTKFLLEKMEESRLLIKTRSMQKGFKNYKQDLEEKIREFLDTNTQYF